MLRGLRPVPAPRSRAARSWTRSYRPYNANGKCKDLRAERAAPSPRPSQQSCLVVDAFAYTVQRKNKFLVVPLKLILSARKKEDTVLYPPRL